jgi:S-adenosylmethionine decarboxylase proenzyme
VNHSTKTLSDEERATAAMRADYEFQGHHLMASFTGCDTTALLDGKALLEHFTAAARNTGATIIDCCHHTFPNGGVTAVLLLSESHASIHTYPEKAACFLDLFTCGESIDQSKFVDLMAAYLKPTQRNSSVFNRDHLVAPLVRPEAGI